MRSPKGLFTWFLLAAIMLFAGSISPVAAQEQLTSGTPEQGKLSAGTATYTITGGRGQILTISVESTEFDAQVTLVDSLGAELATDDDSGEGTNALLAYVPQTEGTFTVLVSSWGSETGVFTITANVMVPPTVELGQTVPLDLTGQPVTYAAFTGNANSAVNIYTTSPDESDLYLTVYGVDGQEMASDDDSGPGTAPYLRRINLPEDGIYLVKIESLYGEALTTPASITVESTERLYLTTTPQTVTLGEEALNYEVFTLEVTAGTTYRIVVTSENNEGLRLQINEAGGSFGQSLSADAGYRVAWDYQAQSSGLMRIHLYPEYSSADTVYSIALESVG